MKNEVAAQRTDGTWDEVMATATELAGEMDISTVVQRREERKFLEGLMTVTIIPKA